MGISVDALQGAGLGAVLHASCKMLCVLPVMLYLTVLGFMVLPVLQGKRAATQAVCGYDPDSHFR
jgi:hypothetical protein